jgi:hypothetical protein
MIFDNLGERSKKESIVRRYSVECKITKTDSFGKGYIEHTCI